MVRDKVFVPSFGNRPSRLVGRESVLETFDEALASVPGSRERAVLLLGQRGFGKTVLLWEFADRAREAGFVVATPTVSAEGMLGRIVEKIQDDGERYVRERRSVVTGASVGVLGFSAGLQFDRVTEESKSFQYKLTLLCRRLNEQGRGVLVLVDEVQANTPEMRELVIAYQELVGEGADVALAAAGLPGAVSAMLNDRVLTFLNRACKIDLGPLTQGDVDAYYAAAFRELGVDVSEDVRSEAVKATMGSPYMVQLVGHYLVQYAASTGTVGQLELRRALAVARGDFEGDVCRTALAALSGRDVDFLRAMTRDKGDSSVSDIAERLGVSVDYAQKYRRRLIDGGIIRASRRGMVQFSVPYLADYLRGQEDW